MKNCKTCHHWKQHKYQTPSEEWWGNCTFIEASDDCQSHIVVYGNNKDGEWCGVTVETKEDFRCILHSQPSERKKPYIIRIIVPEQTISLEDKPMSRVEASLKDCPMLNISLFGYEIELALTEWQMWPPSPADGVMQPDLEVTGMDWRFTGELVRLVQGIVKESLGDFWPWNPVHAAAVTALGLDRGLQSKFMEEIERWIKNRNQQM